MLDGKETKVILRRTISQIKNFLGIITLCKKTQPQVHCCGIASRFIWYVVCSLYPFCRQSAAHDGKDQCVQKSPDRFTVADLQRPDAPPSQSGCVCLERPFIGISERRAVTGSLGPTFSNARVRERIFVCVSEELADKWLLYTTCCKLCVYMCREQVSDQLPDL